MKKLQFIAGSIFYLLSACASLSCSNLDDVTPELSRVKLRAMHDSATRVSFDGSTSKWEDGDNINVVLDRLNKIYNFTYEASSEDYFYCDNIPVEDGDNIYAFYGVPSSSINTAQNNALVALTPSDQNQDITSPISHISEYDVLYGKAVNIDTDNISVSMNHTIAAVKINITNALPNTCNVSSITLTAPDNVILAGSYVINAASNSQTHSASANDSNIVSVSLSDDIQMANGSSYTVWAAVTPFTLNPDEKLIIDVTTDDSKTYRCEKTIGSSGLDFCAGSVMSTQIVLGNNATLVAPTVKEDIFIKMDFDGGGILPDGFPNSDKKGITSGTYEICGYDFEFNSPSIFFSNKNDTSYRIRFASGIKKDNPATIKLPYIEGYKLSEVTMSSTDNNKTQSRNYRFSVINSDGTVIPDNDPDDKENSGIILSSTKETYTMNDATGKDWYVRISHESSDARHVDLSYLSLKYVSE